MSWEGDLVPILLCNLVTYGVGKKLPTNRGGGMCNKSDPDAS